MKEKQKLHEENEKMKERKREIDIKGYSWHKNWSDRKCSGRNRMYSDPGGKTVWRPDSTCGAVGLRRGSRS